MKITAFNGSPQAEKSATHVIVQKFLEGAEAAGATVDNVFLINQNINHCTGCFACWFKTPGRCIFNDDMELLLEKYMSSDIICLATPVYTWNMTAALKNFVDRLVPLRCPVATQAEGRYDMNVRMKFPEAVVISNAGFPGENNFATIKEVFKSANPVLEIYRNCGKLLKASNPELKAVVEEYLDYVKQAGFELGSGQAVSDTTKEKLQMELVRPDQYIKMMNI